jgi:hypothetical protein
MRPQSVAKRVASPFPAPALSAVSILPVLGDAIGKGGKLAKYGAEGLRAIEAAEPVAVKVTKLATRGGHHPFAKFLGGEALQWLSKIDPKIHGEFHDLLRQGLKDAGFKLPIGGKAGSTKKWLRYFEENPGAQRKAIDAMLDASRSIDAKHGTHITQDLWKNIIEGRFDAIP